jgi:hypothetical protein
VVAGADADALAQVLLDDGEEVIQAEPVEGRVDCGGAAG